MSNANGRPRSIPSYRRHKASRQGIVTLADGLGGRRDVLLGKYKTKASQAQYERVIAEWLANGRRLATPTADAPTLTMNELMLRFMEHADRTTDYRPASPPVRFANTGRRGVTRRDRNSSANMSWAARGAVTTAACSPRRSSSATMSSTVASVRFISLLPSVSPATVPRGHEKPQRVLGV
jgi:hypothetical protein